MPDSLQYDKGIQKIAAHMTGCSIKHPSFLAEELRSEMHVAILEMEDGLSEKAYLRRAGDRAKNFIRQEAKHSRYNISLDAMQESGYQVDTSKRVYAPDKQHY